MSKHEPIATIGHSFRLLSSILLLVLTLTACGSLASTPTPEPISPTAPLVTEPATTSEATTIPATVEAPETATAEVTKVDAITQLALDYLDGKPIDTSALTVEQRTELSKKIVDKLESQRGPQVIYYDNADGTISYLNVATGEFEQAPKSALQDPEFTAANTPRAYEAISFDEQGNVIIHTAKGDITVPDSAGMDWTAVDSDHMDRINWPTGDQTPKATAFIGGGADGGVYVPIVFETNQLIDLPVQYGDRWLNTKGFAVFAPITDAKGNLLGFRKAFILAAADTFQIQIEGSNSAVYITSTYENVGEPQKLKQQTIYYMDVFPNQISLWGYSTSNIANYKGIIPLEAVPASVKGQGTGKANAVILIDMLIEKTNQ